MSMSDRQVEQQIHLALLVPGLVGASEEFPDLSSLLLHLKDFVRTNQKTTNVKILTLENRINALEKANESISDKLHQNISRSKDSNKETLRRQSDVGKRMDSLSVRIENFNEIFKT